MTAMKGKGERDIESMRSRLEGELEKFRKTRQEESEVQERLHTDETKREMLKELSGEKLRLRRELSRKEAAIKDRLFEEVGELLDEYRGTDAYPATLLDMIKGILEFAGDDPVNIYLCPSDAHLKDRLEAESGVELTVSSVSFNGGIQAEIPSRNIFINDSFSSRVGEKKAAYRVITDEK